MNTYLELIKENAEFICSASVSQGEYSEKKGYAVQYALVFMGEAASKHLETVELHGKLNLQNLLEKLKKLRNLSSHHHANNRIRPIYDEAMQYIPQLNILLDGRDISPVNDFFMGASLSYRRTKQQSVEELFNEAIIQIDSAISFLDDGLYNRSDKTQNFALCMAFLLIGKCARELENNENFNDFKDKTNYNFEFNGVSCWASLKELRDDLAHHIEEDHMSKIENFIVGLKEIREKIFSTKKNYSQYQKLKKQDKSVSTLGKVVGHSSLYSSSSKEGRGEDNVSSERYHPYRK